MTSQEELQGVTEEALWSPKRSPLETEEELPVIANLVLACFPPKVHQEHSVIHLKCTNW